MPTPTLAQPYRSSISTHIHRPLLLMLNSRSLGGKHVGEEEGREETAGKKNKKYENAYRDPPINMSPKIMIALTPSRPQQFHKTKAEAPENEKSIRTPMMQKGLNLTDAFFPSGRVQLLQALCPLLVASQLMSSLTFVSCGIRLCVSCGAVRSATSS